MAGLFAGNAAGAGQALLDYIYPVGSIYMSMQAADPALLFGGSWQAITDAFLLPAAQSGQTGGGGNAYADRRGNALP